jgi:hypothetical protein
MSVATRPTVTSQTMFNTGTVNSRLTHAKKVLAAFTAGDMHILILANTTVSQYMFNSTILGHDQKHFFVL